MVTAPYRDPDGKLKRVELFYTIQGEGPDAGRPAIFLRLSHCNLRCWFCDTQFEEGTVHSLENMLSDVLQLSGQHRCTLLVITGGEPLLQNIVPLTKAVNAHGISVSVETAGTTYYDELATVFNPLRSIGGNLVVCSPKTPKVHPGIESICGAWKYIIRAGEVGTGGFPCMSTQKEGTPANLYVPLDVSVPIYVQPCDEYDDRKNAENLQEASRVSLVFGHRLGVQIHKMAGLR